MMIHFLWGVTTLAQHRVSVLLTGVSARVSVLLTGVSARVRVLLTGVSARVSVLLTGVRHDGEVPLLVVLQQLVHVEHGVLLVRDVEPRGHDGVASQHHAPPLLLGALLHLKHVLHCPADHGLGQIQVSDAFLG